MLSSFESNLWGIEILYIVAGTRNKNNVLNRTYEGLKFAGYGVKHGRINRFWIEPMRDWNTKYTLKLTAADMGFESNLWGIEI